MRRVRPGRAVALAAISALALAGAMVGPTPTAAQAPDPSSWSNGQLAAQLVMAGAGMSQLDLADQWAQQGIGGIVLMGGNPPPDLRARLARVRQGNAVVPFVAADEEGGQVQRLARVIYPLPSAEATGSSRTAAQARATAHDYGLRMRELGVDMNLAPVADLAIPGYYIERTDRGYSADPARAGTYVAAVTAGMRDARVAPALKHWPGHGQATDTHQGTATTPPLSTLERRDLAPFDAGIRAGADVVMVGHLDVPGLTERGTPATLSPAAYRYLRNRVGGRALLITDSLSMGAISARGLSPAEASYRALRAGADVVLVNSDPQPVFRRLAEAIGSGAYPRERAVASVRRILAVKAFTNAAPAPLSGVGVATSGNGGATAAYRTLGGRVVVRFVDKGVFQGGADLGGSTTHPPAVTRAGASTYVVVRGTDGHVYQRVLAGAVWSGWQRLPLTTVDAPAVAGRPDGSLDLGLRTATNRFVVHRVEPMSGLGPATDIGLTTAAPALALASSSELVAALRDAQGRLTVRSRTLGWESALFLGGATDAAPALAADLTSGTLLLGVRGGDAAFWTRSRVAGSWSGWASLGGRLTAGPGMGSVVPGTVLLVVRGLTNDLFTRYWTEGAWAGGYRRWY